MRGGASTRPLAGTEWKFLADSRPAAVTASRTAGAKKRADALEDHLLQQFPPTLDLGEFGAETGTPTIASDDPSIPSDHPDMTPVARGHGRPRFVPSRRAPPSSIAPNSEGESDPAPRKGDARNDDVRNEPPDHSPVIIWRHAAPVKLATNVPPELLFPGQTDVYESSTLRSPTSEAGGEKGASTGSPSKAAKPKATGYGAAWYMPVDEWDACAKGVDLGAKGATEAGGGGGKGGSDGRSRGDDVPAEAVSSLYSSKLYREYLRDNKITRVPDYLDAAEDLR